LKKIIGADSLYENYNKHVCEGFLKILLDYAHEQLERTLPIANGNAGNVLEVGPGTNPHIRFVGDKFEKYSFADISDFSIDHLRVKFAGNELIHVEKYDGVVLPYESGLFDRVIICHTLEHVPEPEKMLIEVDRVLKKGGILSISLPCDPGLLWRLGRCLTTARNAKKKLGLSKPEYYYVMSKEHINAINNLVSLLTYHFAESLEEYYLPLGIKSYDLNFIYNCHIVK
jgi:phosphatidylethanolamine/phosphatidyl-N-methylethanolamine N-methyltransferase